MLDEHTDQPNTSGLEKEGRPESNRKRTRNEGGGREMIRDKGVYRELANALVSPGNISPLRYRFSV